MPRSAPRPRPRLVSSTCKERAPVGDRRRAALRFRGPDQGAVTRGGDRHRAADGGRAERDQPSLQRRAGEAVRLLAADPGLGQHRRHTLYVADNSVGAVVKYGLVGGTWVQQGSVVVAGVTGVMPMIRGGAVTIYADQQRPSAPPAPSTRSPTPAASGGELGGGARRSGAGPGEPVLPRPGLRARHRDRHRRRQRAEQPGADDHDRAHRPARRAGRPDQPDPGRHRSATRTSRPGS